MKTKSFTLIELLVVIVIIGVLAGVITLSVSSNISKAQDLKISSTILSISKTLKADSYDSFPIEVAACNLKNSCTTLKARIDLPNITEDIYYKTSSSGKFFVIYTNKPSNTSLSFEITSIDENVKEVPSFDNLVAYYPLAVGAANGTAISDMSPNANNGTNNGASSATGADGNVGTAMSFDGVNDVIIFNYNETFNIREAITLSVWLKRETTYAITDDNHILSRYPSWYFYDSYSSGQIQGDVFIDGVRRGARTVPVPYDNNWYLITYTYDSNTRISSIYKNGIIESSTTLSGLSNYLIDESTSNIYVNGGNEGKVLVYQDARIYNRALSQEEITLLYNK